MAVLPRPLDERAVEVALDEIQSLIRTRFPEAVFEIGPSYDPWGVYVRVMVDVEDPEDVTDAIMDRLLDIQVERRLPIWVVVLPPSERVIADLGGQPPHEPTGDGKDRQ